MSDLIDRQAALDAIMGQPPEPHYPSWYAAQIEKLPAVQPDHTADISKKVEGDCISRQAAIDALARMMPRSYTPDGSHPADEEIFRAQEVFADCIEALEILSPAQPERVEGEWVQIQRCARDAQPDLECPFCKHRIGWFDMGRYCAGCGAKLEGGAG